MKKLVVSLVAGMMCLSLSADTPKIKWGTPESYVVPAKRSPTTKRSTTNQAKYDAYRQRLKDRRNGVRFGTSQTYPVPRIKFGVPQSYSRIRFSKSHSYHGDHCQPSRRSMWAGMPQVRRNIPQGLRN